MESVLTRSGKDTGFRIYTDSVFNRSELRITCADTIDHVSCEKVKRKMHIFVEDLRKCLPVLMPALQDRKTTIELVSYGRIIPLDPTIRRITIVKAEKLCVTWL